jgi:hypothetical protein
LVHLPKKWSSSCVATIGIATLGVGFLASFQTALGGSPALNLATFGGVAMLGVGFPTSFLLASLDSFSRKMLACGGVATVGFAMLSSIFQLLVQ